MLGGIVTPTAHQLGFVRPCFWVSLYPWMNFARPPIGVAGLNQIRLNFTFRGSPNEPWIFYDSRQPHPPAVMSGTILC